MAETVRTSMTTEVFLQLPRTNLRSELINGEHVETDTNNELHRNAAHGLIVALLRLLPDGEFWSAPVHLYLDKNNIFQPDLFFVGSDNPNCKLVNGRWYGAPELVIEIFSPNTEPRDKATKFELYERQGVFEYWIVNPQEKYVEVWIFSENKCTRLNVLEPDLIFYSYCLINKPVDITLLFKYLKDL
jgi:Uma2 family endonuclease